MKRFEDSSQASSSLALADFRAMPWAKTSERFPRLSNFCPTQFKLKPSRVSRVRCYTHPTCFAVPVANRLTDVESINYSDHLRPGFYAGDPGLCLRTKRGN